VDYSGMMMMMIMMNTNIFMHKKNPTRVFYHDAKTACKNLNITLNTEKFTNKIDCLLKIVDQNISLFEN
jgi:hypothetical protein